MLSSLLDTLLSVYHRHPFLATPVACPSINTTHEQTRESSSRKPGLYLASSLCLLFHQRILHLLQ